MIMNGHMFFFFLVPWFSNAMAPRKKGLKMPMLIFVETSLLSFRKLVKLNLGSSLPAVCRLLVDGDKAATNVTASQN